MKSIKEAEIGHGTKVLIRADWNLPISDVGEILDTSRLVATKETIDLVLNAGGSAIVMSHFGEQKESIIRVVTEAQKLFPKNEVIFVADPFNEEGRAKLAALSIGQIVVLENLRFWLGEKDNDPQFAKDLASLAHLYVNEAFPVSHRRHASLVGVPKFLPHFAGLHFMKEFEKLSEVFNPEHPFLFILGGAKFETKLPLVEKFLNIADEIFIGGEIAFHVLSSPIAGNPKVVLPVGDLTALDANQETLEMLGRKIARAKFIVWNGPLGNYENGYKNGTLGLAKLLADSQAKVIVGGGDTLAAIKELDSEKSFYFISTAGGAMLDFLSSGTLPGIEALDSTRIHE